MTAGLPGTGIGGLFYLLLVVLMPVRELLVATRDRPSTARLRTIGVNMAIAAGILASLLGSSHLIGLFFDLMAAIEAIGPSLRQAARDAGAISSRVAMFTALSILLFLVSTTALFDLLLRREAGRTTRTPSRTPRASSD